MEAPGEAVVPLSESKARAQFGWQVMALPQVCALAANPNAPHTPRGVALLERVNPDTQSPAVVLSGVAAALDAGVSPDFFSAWYARHFRAKGKGK